MEKSKRIHIPYTKAVRNKLPDNLELDSWLKKKLERTLCPLNQLMRKYAQLDSKENFIT